MTDEQIRSQAMQIAVEITKQLAGSGTPNINENTLTACLQAVYVKASEILKHVETGKA